MTEIEKTLKFMKEEKGGDKLDLIKMNTKLINIVNNTTIKTNDTINNIVKSINDIGKTLNVLIKQDLKITKKYARWCAKLESIAEENKDDIVNLSTLFVENKEATKQDIEALSITYDGIRKDIYDLKKDTHTLKENNTELAQANLDNLKVIVENKKEVNWVIKNQGSDIENLSTVIQTSNLNHKNIKFIYRDIEDIRKHCDGRATNTIKALDQIKEQLLTLGGFACDNLEEIVKLNGDLKDNEEIKASIKDTREYKEMCKEILKNNENK